MADVPVGRRLLHFVLVCHLAAFGTSFLLFERYAAWPGWLCQFPLWVIIPVWLVRETERGRVLARWLFALLLAFLAVGHAVAAAAWTRVPVNEGEDQLKFTLSALFAVGYSVGTAVVVLSPAVRRLAAAERAARAPGRGNGPTDPGAEHDHNGIS